MAQDLPLNHESDQPDVTGMPLIYNDKSTRLDEITKQNRKWDEAGRKAHKMTAQNQEQAAQPEIDIEAKILLERLASQNREMFAAFLTDAKTAMQQTLKQTAALSPSHQAGTVHPSPHALLDRWYIRFESHKHNIESAQNASEATKFRIELYNDAMATLFDMGMEMSRLIAAVESN